MYGNYKYLQIINIRTITIGNGLKHSLVTIISPINIEQIHSFSANRNNDNNIEITVLLIKDNRHEINSYISLYTTSKLQINKTNVKSHKGLCLVIVEIVIIVDLIKDNLPMYNNVFV